MFILTILNFCIVGFAIKYLFINYFSHINFINGQFSKIYLFMVSLTISDLTMVNFVIIVSFMFILAILILLVASLAKFIYSWLV